MKVTTYTVEARNVELVIHEHHPDCRCIPEVGLTAMSVVDLRCVQAYRFTIRELTS